jgi:predicted esterase
MRILLAVLLVCTTAVPLLAQDERYELGQRLKRFEAAWEKHTEVEGRARALKLLPEITPMFFSLRFGEAGGRLDEAVWTLANRENRSLAEQWLMSLYAAPETRLMVAGEELSVTVKSFYKLKTDTPEKANVTLSFNGGTAMPVSLAKLPTKVRLPVRLVEGVPRKDCVLRLEAKLDDRTISVRECTVSVVPDLEATMAKFKTAGRREPATLESATLRDREEFLNELKDAPGETDYPVVKMIEEGNTILATERYFDHTKSGQFWLSIPLEKKKTLPVRLFVPKNLEAKKVVPIVIALHGAGGSENLFFEGYGAGHIVKECEKRGWLLVAPRSPLGASGPPVKLLLDKLAERYPIDRERVFIVGHSMGAAQTIATCQEYPDLFAGAAALGGGGRVKDAKNFEKLPLTIGVGDKDFALSGARALAKALPSAKFKEYPNIEHMVIVREALPDVFAIWDGIVGKK